MKDWLKNLWLNNKKKIVAAGIIIIAAVAVFAYGCSVGMGCN